MGGGKLINKHQHIGYKERVTISIHRFTGNMTEVGNNIIL